MASSPFKTIVVVTVSVVLHDMPRQTTPL